MSKISDLPEATPTGAERIVMVQHGRTVGAPLNGVMSALAEPFVDAAQDSATRAELAALAALLSKPLFDTIALGEAATVAGDIFSVRAGGEDFATLYRRTPPGSDLLGSYPSSLAVAMRVRLTDLQSGDVAKGAGMVGFDLDADYAEGTVGAALKRYSDMFDDGLWDATARIEDDGAWG